MGATFFFRDHHTLKMIPELIIPEILANKYESGEMINVWSAGCANGSEPYTLAMILKENLPCEIFDKITIFATDIDPNSRFESIIKRGSYSGQALKKVPGEMFEKYFDEDKDILENWIISADLRKSLRYIRHDLGTNKPPADVSFDIIICKNVLLHFQNEKSLEIMGMFYDSLTNPGFLITEQTQKIPLQMKGKFIQFVKNAQIHKKVFPK